jgi:hypothetical protein
MTVPPAKPKIVDQENMIFQVQSLYGREATKIIAERPSYDELFPCQPAGSCQPVSSVSLALEITALPLCP